MNAHRLYVAWIVYLYVTGQDNAYETYRQVYGGTHSQSEGDIQYVVRCAEQDFLDGERDAAVYQEVYNSLMEPYV